MTAPSWKEPPDGSRSALHRARGDDPLRPHPRRHRKRPHRVQGIPYAAPPVGSLRWLPAQPHPGCNGTLDATAYSPSAPQAVREGDPVLGSHGLPPFDEDCLTLNVWTPGTDDAGRPVLVWIHGGAFISGSAAMPHYSGETFARDGDLVVVNPNHRLGPLGLLHFE
ncbi:carboxylesterase family protein [Streptomyces sp. NPDC058646]|uniref:carboxylesterase family protein n=1 Tax=Streptomyces sp. NPDC058646 TaxID=3346574 RepID=UPI00365CA3B8